MYLLPFSYLYEKTMNSIDICSEKEDGTALNAAA